MNNLFRISGVILVVLSIFLIHSCKKDKPTSPIITTTAISVITQTTASSGGNITNDGGATVTARGVCWSTTTGPTTALSTKTTDNPGTGIFTSSITGLTAGTVYYVRAYATNSAGTAYGSQVTFTTSQIALPTLTTINATDIGSSSATLGGNIISNGDGSITESGIYFGTSVNPETAGTKIKSDVTTNVYSIDLNDLLPNTIYYVKAYATNSKGTNFGNQISFTTAEFKFGIIDVSQTSAWNYWVVAKDGSSYFVTLKNNKPVSVYFKPDKNKNGFVIYFDDKGLPSKMVIDNYVLLFTNYRNQMVDAAIISPNNDVSFQRDLKVNIDMSKFFQKGFTSDLLFGLGLTSDAIGIASCVGGIIGIASGIGAIPGALLATGCASTVIGIASEIFPENFKVAGPVNKIAGYVAGIAGCASLPGISDCVTTAADLALEFVTLANDRIENPNIADADKILGQGFMVSTNTVSETTFNSAKVGGNIITNGVNNITERGVYYGTLTNPENNGTKVQMGNGSGNFTSYLLTLAPNTTYYVKAYATNSVGTAYGSELTFTTSAAAPVIPTLTTVAATSITQTTASSGGNITSNGGAMVTASGVCWSTTTNPTISLSPKTTDGSATGSFTSSITGLTASTTYYIRAYAINSAGTAYGTQVSFTTTAASQVVIPTLSTTAASSIASTSATSGGNITSDGGASVTSRGICWSTSQNPTASNSKTSDGTGTGTFTSSLTGLSANTTYYVRAYAINSAGTAYGTQQSFNTGQTNTRIISLSGNLTFGNVTVGQSSSKTLTISNTGTSPLSISSISPPQGFSGNFNGIIQAGGSVNVTINFSPLNIQSYSGNITVISDATSGTSTININGNGVSVVPTVVPALGTYGACGVGVVGCSPNVSYGLEMINARIVSINTSAHQIVVEIKKCDGTAFNAGGNLNVVNLLCGGTGSVSYGFGSFSAGSTTFQMTITDNNMVGLKAYVPFIVQTTSFTYYYSAPAMVITY